MNTHTHPKSYEKFEFNFSKGNILTDIISSIKRPNQTYLVRHTVWSQFYPRKFIRLIHGISLCLRPRLLYLDAWMWVCICEHKKCGIKTSRNQHTIVETSWNRGSTVVSMDQKVIIYYQQRSNHQTNSERYYITLHQNDSIFIKHTRIWKCATRTDGVFSVCHFSLFISLSRSSDKTTKRHSLVYKTK